VEPLLPLRGHFYRQGGASTACEAIPAKSGSCFRCLRGCFYRLGRAASTPAKSSPLSAGPLPPPAGLFLLPEWLHLLLAGPLLPPLGPLLLPVGLFLPPIGLLNCGAVIQW